MILVEYCEVVSENTVNDIIVSAWIFYAHHLRKLLAIKTKISN